MMAPAQSICISCGHAVLLPQRLYRCKSAQGRALFGGSQLYRCQGCGLIQACPIPSLPALAEYYAEDYRNHCLSATDTEELTKFPLDNLFYYNRGQSVAELLASRVASSEPRILDIGAGYGHILHAMGERFPGGALSAIEFSNVCVEHLRSRGITVYAEPAEDVLPALAPFDVIVLSHALEHFLDPGAMLRLIASRLSSGGILYVEVPHIPEEAMHRYIDSVWAPRVDEPHITFFDPRSLNGVLAASGLAVELCTTAGPEYSRVSALQFHIPHWRWLFERIIPKPVFRFLRRQRAAQSLKVNPREEAFYRQGGFRIWIRAIARRAAA
ncbi:MAG TPA: class I SAM-dependent methyltransferase [Paludibaculum sp.]|jgi:SAM-dependent methyltransferase